MGWADCDTLPPTSKQLEPEGSALPLQTHANKLLRPSPKTHRQPHILKTHRYNCILTPFHTTHPPGVAELAHCDPDLVRRTSFEAASTSDPADKVDLVASASGPDGRWGGKE